MVASSKPSLDASTRTQELEYLYASNANVVNFVSVKLSGESNYNFWKTQMLCLMETHNMRGIVDADFANPRDSSTMRQYDSLLKGWIFGSISEDVFGKVIDLDSAKLVWEELKSIYAQTVNVQQCEDSTEIKEEKKKDEFQITWDNMQFGKCISMLDSTTWVDTNHDVEFGYLLTAISLKQYSEYPIYIALVTGLNIHTVLSNILADLASALIRRYPHFATLYDSMALDAVATYFPNGLNYGETLFNPSSLKDIKYRMLESTKSLFKPSSSFYSGPFVFFYRIVCFLISMFYVVILALYLPMWEVATRIIAPINQIEKKHKEWKEAKILLKSVCDEISRDSGNLNKNYTKPLLEATRNNCYEVVEEILSSQPQAIRCVDKNGYDIIQLAVIHRSEKIYNLIYHSGGYKSPYRTKKDSSNNNMLHLAGRLAPSRKLKQRTGAVLQLQQELQWIEELKRWVCPTVTTEENKSKETPDMVFTREHADLMKEGEEWMKATAESCSITAALITTMVFAAGITVPGGNNDKGTPLFTNDIAFTIFAISDAISLFTSSTSLLVFLSVLTARFAEQDFLVSLPRRLVIGLCTLFISTAAIMVAFGATLFLVFCRQKPWMLAPLCGLAFLPIAVFVTLQFPLIVDLFSSTNVRSFGKISKSDHRKFNPDDIEFILCK